MKHKHSHVKQDLKSCLKRFYTARLRVFLPGTFASSLCFSDALLTASEILTRMYVALILEGFNAILGLIDH